MEEGFTIAHGWLVAGVVFLALEAFGVPGIGFLFAGLAAIVTGLIVHFNLIALDDPILQLGFFAGITALLAAVLWRKLQNWRSNTNSNSAYSNMVGDMATVGKGGLKKGEIGQASWSGTTMMATLDDTADCESVPQGAMVTITAVKGTQLIVAPKAKAA